MMLNAEGTITTLKKTKTYCLPATCRQKILVPLKKGIPLCMILQLLRATSLKKLGKLMLVVIDRLILAVTVMTVIIVIKVAVDTIMLAIVMIYVAIV